MRRITGAGRHELTGLIFCDARIVASAEDVGAEEILSEDLNDGQSIAGIRLVNPFKGL